MLPTKNLKMEDYPNIQRRFRIGAAKKKKKKKVNLKFPLEMDLEDLCKQDVVMHQPSSCFYN